MIESGRLNKRVDLQQATEDRDATGGTTRTWTTIVTRWAAIEPAKGREAYIFGQVESRTIIKIRIRYHADIDTTWRIQFGSKIFNIESLVNSGERNEFIDLFCEETIGAK